jgi:hypothetical protein
MRVKLSPGHMHTVNWERRTLTVRQSIVDADHVGFVFVMDKLERVCNLNDVRNLNSVIYQFAETSGP